MAKLPKAMREEIMDLFDQGYSIGQIFDKVLPRIDLPEGILWNCIRSLKDKATLRAKRRSEQYQLQDSPGTERQNRYSYSKDMPSRLSILGSAYKTGFFDTGAYSDLRQKIIDQGTNYAATEQYYKQIAINILENLEGFKSIISGPSVSEHQGTPFDLFGIRDKNFAIIELKGSLRNFNLPGKTQLVRMEDLLTCLAGKNINVIPYILQINLDKGIYHLWDKDGVYSLFQGTDKSLGKFRPIEPIANWVLDKVKLYSLKNFNVESQDSEKLKYNYVKDTAVNSPVILHPPNYLEKQIRPAIARDDTNAEIVWTYVVAKMYENNIFDLANILCGREEKLPENTHIWLEAYLHPTRIPPVEGSGWKCRADLAIGCLKKDFGTRHRISADGSWICIAEAKWLDDIREVSKYPQTNQLARLIDHSLLMHDNKNKFPERVYVTLVTPKCFRQPESSCPVREYYHKYREYTDDKKCLINDLMLGPSSFGEGLNQEILMERVDALVLNWVTFEELLGLDNLILPQIPDKHIARHGTWKDVFKEMGRLDVFSTLA